MHYSVKVRETQVWDIWYDVEADSADDAVDKVYYNGESYRSDFLDTIDTEILDVEPYVD